MSTTAFPVRQTSEGVGCTDFAMRRIFGALYPDTGIVTGLTVTGGNSLGYTVAEGVAVCSKGEADGSTLAYCEGGTVAVKANSASNPRIDVVWVTAHDVTQGDSDNLVTLGVTQGTAAASPTEPAIPAYATKLAAMQMPAGATTTASATQYGKAPVAVPYGATMGLLGEYVDESWVDAPYDSTWRVVGTVTLTLPTRRLVEVVHETRCHASTESSSSFYLKLNVDGADVTDGGDEQIVFSNWVRGSWRYIAELDAGTHVVNVYQKQNTYSPAGKVAIDGWRCTRCWDRGLAD